MLTLNDNHQKQKKNLVRRQDGFSLVELIIVLLIVSILTVLSVLTFRTEKRYLADAQSYLIIDLLAEARQRSLTQHQTIRVEINKTRNLITLISENEPESVMDDKEIKNLKLKDGAEIVVGVKPENVYKAPTEMSPTPELVFKKSVYPMSSGDTVATLRFVRTGIVLDGGSNAAGDNSAMTGAIIYVWQPDYSYAGNPLKTGNLIRAITVQGTSGLARYWKCNLIKGGCENWVQ